MIEGAVFHHVGCLVPDLAAAVEGYRGLWGEACASKVYEVTGQSVRVCFITPQAGGVAVELVEPASGTSLHAQLGKGSPYYHTAYEVPALDHALAAAARAGCRCMVPFVSAAFDGRRCAFLYTPQRHLIELIEAS